MKYLEDMLDLVIKKITDREKPNKPISDYEIAKRLTKLDPPVPITQNGVLSYRKPQVKSMRWDVMDGLAEVGPLSDKEVMSFVRQARKANKGKK